MPRVTMIQFDGQEHIIQAEVGKSLMQNALDNGIPGIDADCGGACACGTCHCFVADDWLPVVGAANAMEEAMLGMRPDRATGSRLSCQVQVTDAMDGLVVRLPEFQM